MPRQYIRISGTLEERLDARTDKSGECWLWTGSVGSHGYGQLKVGKRPVLVHRLAWEVHNGPIPPGMEVAHHCDVHACLRPDHLFLATHKENMRDMSHKGRSAHEGSYGENHPTSKLTDDMVREMRKMRESGMSMRDIARHLGVSYAATQMVLSGMRWTHVT